MEDNKLGKNTLLGGSKDTSEAQIIVPTSSGKANPSSFDSIGAIASFLDKTDPKTKVKVKILDFESFRQFLPLVNRYDNKFSLFKYETDFTIISDNNQKVVLTEMISFKESFINWLKNQKIDLKIMEILKKEIENA